MLHKTRWNGPHDGTTIYTPSFNTMNRHARRNLKRDIGNTDRAETINVLSGAFAFFMFFLMIFPGIPLMGGNHIFLPEVIFAILLALTGVVWGILRFDAREGAPVGTSFPIDDARWYELQKALKNRTLYSGEPAWTRFDDVMRGEEETPFTVMLDTYVTEYMDSMKHHPDMLKRLEAHTKGNEEITRKWIQHQDELERAAEACADLIAQVIDAHDFPAAEPRLPAMPAIQSHVLQEEDVEWLNAQSVITPSMLDGYFNRQGQKDFA